MVPEFIALLRNSRSPVYTDHETYPNIADVTADFVYARLQRGEDKIPTAYPPKELDALANRLRTWAEGKEPKDLAGVDPSTSQRPRRATYLPMSFTRARSARRPRRWR